MTSLRSILVTISAELRTDKVQTRNKAAEQLDKLLKDSKTEIVKLFCNQSASNDFSGTELFSSVIEAVLAHSVKLQEARDVKSGQTLRNKNFVYRGIINNLIDYHLEDENHFLSKSCLFVAFTEGFRSRCALSNFGSMFLDLLERGIYRTPTFVRELKVNEYSRILSYLFEVNVGNDDVLRFGTLSAIIKTLELAIVHVQIGPDLIDYLPEVQTFAHKANMEQRRADVIKLFFLFVSQLSIDYHHTICSALQDQIAVIISFYQHPMKADVKETFFQSVYLALNTLYPHMSNENIKLLPVRKTKTWPNTLDKLQTIVEKEVKVYKTTVLTQKKNLDEHWFLKMAACVTYLKLWPTKDSMENQKSPDSRAKIKKPVDQLELILGLVQSDSSQQLDTIWLAIFTEIVCNYKKTVHEGNIYQVLQTSIRLMRTTANIQNICFFRRYLIVLLEIEDNLISRNYVSPNYCSDIWTELIRILKSNSTTDIDIIVDQQLLFQALIPYRKLTTEDCNALLESFINNATMKRNECIKTVHQILRFAEVISFDKNSNIIERLTKWIYDTNEKVRAQQMLQGVAPYDEALLAETIAIAVINFLSPNQHINANFILEKKSSHYQDFSLLAYKQNRKFICLDYKTDFEDEQNIKTTNEKTCLFQNNYNLLMLTLNFEPTTDTSLRDILSDLASLKKIVLVMKALVKFEIFDSYNFVQCPLIKRMGLFLNQLEFQLKTTKHRDYNDIVEITNRLEALFEVFVSNSLLIQYLDTQSLEELISFVGHSLSLSATRKSNCELDDWIIVSHSSLKVLSTLCASLTHYSCVFEHIKNYEIFFPTDVNAFFDIVKIFCQHQNVHIEIGEWFVNHLKSLFKRYYTDVHIIRKILQLLPDIFRYIRGFENLIQSMFVAMESLLKIAYRKSYSIELTKSIIQTVQCIAHNFPGFYLKSEFTRISLMVAKFLSFSSFKIQMATVRAITAFVDAKNFNTGAMENYFKLCDEIFSHFGWENLPTTTIDVEENAVSVMVQVLVSFFVFSKFHKQEALKGLVSFCGLRKLKQADLSTFQQIACFYNCSLSILCQPFIESLIHAWISKKYPIIEFPYFLCYANEEQFISQNLLEIVSCLLIYGKPKDLNPLNKYITNDVLKLVLPRVYSFILPYDCKCPETGENGYEEHIKNLKDNASAINLKLTKVNSTYSCETIRYIMYHLRDNDHFENMFGYTVPAVSTNWFDLSFDSVKRCLNVFINEKSTNGAGMFQTMIAKTPLDLLRILQKIQKDCMDFLFSWEKAKIFHVYTTLMDIVFESSMQNSRNLQIEDNFKFFVRDGIFFLLNFLHKANQLDVKKSGLSYLSTVLQKPQVIKECKTLLESYLNEICKSLVGIAEEFQSFEIEKLSTEIIKYLIVENKDEFQNAILLLDEFPAKDCYNELRGFSISLQDFRNEAQEVSTILKSYIGSRSRGIGGVKALRQYVQKHKALLQKENDILYELVNKLIVTVRNSNNWELKNECAMCLGDIGSLKIERAAYFFHSENSIYENESQAKDPTKSFHIPLMRIIDKILIEFNPNTYQAVFEVAEKLSNSVCGSALIESEGYFHVFRSNNKIPNYLDTIASSAAIDWTSILKSTVNSADYNSWICDFMAQVYKNFNWSAFQELSSKNTYFADTSLLPFIKLLISNKDIHLQNILEMLEYFFEEFIKGKADSMELSLTKSIFRDKRVIRKFLDTCECIRTSNNWSLSLNLLNVTEACNYCQAYFMSIMYLEMYYLQEKNNKKSSGEIMENQVFQNVAIKAYESIGCTDAISSFLNPLKSRLHFLNLKNCWSDILLETSSIESDYNDLYASVLKRNGILAVGSINKNSQTIDYEICWRLCQWDVAVNGFLKTNSINDIEQEFQKQHYNALKCLYNQEKNNTFAALSNARHCVVSILDEISIECLQSVYKYLTWLQQLRQIEDFCEVQFYSGANLNEVFGKWKADSNLEYGNFWHKEEILSHQITLFHTAGVRTNRKILEVYKVNPIETCLLNCVNVCMKAGEINLAKKNIARLRNMEHISDKLVKINMLLADAEISFNTNKPEITKSILEFILHSPEMSCLYRVKAIILFGEYLMETNSQTFEQVMKHTFLRASSFLDDITQNKAEILAEHSGFLDSEKFDEFERENRKNVYKAAAKFADREYMQFNTYIKSEEFQMKRKIIHQNRLAAETVNRQNKDRDKSVGATLLKKNATLDEREMQSFESKCIQSLCIAMEYYIKFCNIDETASESTIYRIIALWFSNQKDEMLHNKIENSIPSVPSYKFICGLNQITGRLNSTNNAFLAVLKNLLIKCVQEHPHHTLYKLFPLVFAFVDETSSKTNNRVEIAREIILKGRTKGNASCIKQLETMFPALIEFANVEISPASKTKSMALSEKLRKLKNLDAVQCPTVPLLAAPNQKYNITSIIKWDNTVTLVGGINAPKKLICVSSDGVHRPQLLKGKDDLRQDAVMQQVFAIINNLLKNEPETSKRRLVVRTYSVVPLSMRSGILEWCENTTPLGIYLITAHAKYHPKDFSVSKCRRLSMVHLKADVGVRLEQFNYICANIHPVMHFFLLEKFSVPGIWFERRLAYTNSVATNSIVGFILGLGDRHTQNILIDERTAELIHIDFGIAFEQGKIMPTPETVPFRLTRDIVAPMGICKASGIFKITCEATMEILRRHRSIIITILEVLLYDPLYMWNVLQDKGNKTAEIQSCEETNLTAQRTLLCVQNKLEGKQAGILGTSDVSVQVQRLINEAISAHNLCQLYPGWDPYL